MHFEDKIVHLFLFQIEDLRKKVIIISLKTIYINYYTQINIMLFSILVKE